MRRERGIVTGWLYAIALAVIVAAFAGVYVWGRSDGRALEASEWQQRELAINAATAAKLKEANDKLIATERAHADALAGVSADYQRRLKEADDAKQGVINSLRAGTRKLYIGAKCPAPGGNAVPGIAASPAGPDAEPRAELSEPASEFLVGLASEADAVAVQLAACQAVVAADRAR